MRLCAQAGGEQRELDGLRSRDGAGGSGGKHVERVDGSERIAIGDLALGEAETGEGEEEVELRAVGRTGGGGAGEGAGDVFDDTLVVSLRLEPELGLGGVDGELGGEVWAARA